jgi:DNA-binding MarR family transcriptional regulator
LADELGAWLQHLMAGVEQEVFSVLEELQVTVGQTKVLQVLNACDGEISVKAVGERLQLSLPAASRSVDALVQRGWLERREDPDDRRMKRVRLSPEGQSIVERILEARRDHLTRYAATLSDAERKRLASTLSSLPHHTDPDA